MLYSKQIMYCNAGGKKLEIELPFAIRCSYGYRVCSLDCASEIEWRDTLSIMNKEYYLRENK